MWGRLEDIPPNKSLNISQSPHQLAAHYLLKVFWVSKKYQSYLGLSGLFSCFSDFFSQQVISRQNIHKIIKLNKIKKEVFIRR